MELSEYENLARLEEQHWWYAGMRRIALSWLRRLPLPRPAQILDAGCGTGGGLRWLRSLGSVRGIDLDPQAARLAAQHSAQVSRASVEALPFPAAAFDLVTSFEVLYHQAVRDDRAALRECARVLRPGGWLLLRVPAHDWLRGAHDRQVHTRHRYAARELSAVVRTAGFDLCRLSHVGAALWPAAVVKRLSERSDQPRSDVTLPPQPLNLLLAEFLAVEALWLRLADLPFGLSLLLLARKPLARSQPDG